MSCDKPLSYIYALLKNGCVKLNYTLLTLLFAITHEQNLNNYLFPALIRLPAVC